MNLIVIPTIEDSLIPLRDATEEDIHPDGGEGGEADILFWFNQRSNMPQNMSPGMLRLGSVKDQQLLYLCQRVWPSAWLTNESSAVELILLAQLCTLTHQAKPHTIKQTPLPRVLKEYQSDQFPSLGLFLLSRQEKFTFLKVHFSYCRPSLVEFYLTLSCLMDLIPTHTKTRPSSLERRLQVHLLPAGSPRLVGIRD